MKLTFFFVTLQVTTTRIQNLCKSCQITEEGKFFLLSILIIHNSNKLKPISINCIGMAETSICDTFTEKKL